MNPILTALTQLRRATSLAIWLALAGLSLTPGRAQDVKVNIGGGNAEQAKADKELADKLPPDQAAAYLKNRHAWSTVGDTLQYLAVLALPLGIVSLVLTFRHRRQKLAHETMRLMIEKGLPVPTELINPPPTPKPPKSDLRRGLIWVALGTGLMILLKKVGDEPGLWTLGLIPALIGAAYLVCWAAGLTRERRETGREPSALWCGIFWTFLGVSLALALHSLEHAPDEWDHLAEWWGVGLVPIGVGLAFLLYALVMWWISRKKLAQG
jgi:hypothetical protein